MANEVKKANRDAVRKAIQARRDARKAEKTAQYEKMRACAASPAKFATTLDAIVAKTALQATSMSNLRDNLGLTRFGKNVAAGVKIAVSKRFARVAAEQPDVLADALKEAYKGLDEQAAAMEIAAEALGIDLGATPTEKAFTDEGKHELELGEDKGEEVATEEGPDFEAEEEEVAEEEPVEEKEAAAGSDAFSTDRDSAGAPKAPTKAQIPQAQGEAAKQSAKKKGTEQPRGVTQEFSTNNPPAQGAEKFVKEIPQAQGKSEGNTASTAAKGKPSAKFVTNIPQAQGKAAGMSKKDFIALADAIKNMSVGPDEKRNIAEGLCGTLRAANPRFMKERFMGYVMGENGPSGGTVKAPKPAAPMV